MATRATTEERTPLNRERVLRAAIELADRDGLDGVSMRKLGAELGVEAMSLYNHVANKDDLLVGMVEALVSEIEVVADDLPWKTAMKTQIMNARKVILEHEWSTRAFIDMKALTLPIMDYFERFGRIMTDGGFSIDLLHHAMHALGSRAFGFTQELFTATGGDDDETSQQMMAPQMAERFPNIIAIATQITHDMDSVPGGMMCDDDIEFEFALDILLDGLERKLDAEQAT